MLRAGLAALVLLIPVSAFADPLSDCRDLAGQMQTNAANDALTAHVMSMSYRAEIADLQHQLADITKERDELSEKLKAKPGG